MRLMASATSRATGSASLRRERTQHRSAIDLLLGNPREDPDREGTKPRIFEPPRHRWDRASAVGRDRVSQLDSLAGIRRLGGFQ